MMQDNQPSSRYQWLKLIYKTSVSLIWLIVLLIITAAIGKYIIFATPHSPQSVHITVSKPIIPPIPWQDVDQHLIEAITQARQHTEEFIEPQISQWIDELMQRVDDDFLPWYFSYWNQQWLGLNGLYHGTIHWLKLSQYTAQEQMTETVQEEFATRVLRPEIAQLKIQHLAQKTVEYYINQLQTQLSAIPQKYDIPPAEWERYLDSIAVMTVRTEGNRGTALSLKALAGTTVAGAAILTKALAPMLKNVGAKVTAKLASKAAASIAAKTGAKVVAKVGGEFLGPIVAIGIIIWDVWDHANTKETGLPILRQNILDYFNELKTAIISDSEYGILAIIHQLEAQIVEAVKRNP